MATFLQTGSDVHDVAVLNWIFLAFESELAFGFRLIHRPEADQVFVGSYPCPSKSALQVGVFDIYNWLILFPIRKKKQDSKSN